MENKQSVFDRLDSLEQQNAVVSSQTQEIINLLNNIQSKQQTTPQKEQTEKITDRDAIIKFAREAKKEYLWFGPASEFNKSKRLLNVACLALIIVAVISTILTSVAFKMYSTFTLFENIWSIFVCIILSYSCKSRQRMSDIMLKAHSCFLFEQDDDGTWRDTCKEKKRFKWFRRISYIAVVANIIVIWTSAKGGIAIAATIFEVVFLGLSIAVYFARENFTCMYENIILFTGKNLSNNSEVTIVFDVLGRKLYPFDEYKSKFKFLFE